ncbi:MAG: 2,3-bisphosphoglycerate-independent phosphoglycerate mutase [Saprospiraceae bacterium]
MKNNHVLLVILDGWGHGPNAAVSAIAQANTPFVDSLYEKYPHSELITYGEEVGLPDGQMGNSEVGHLNIGAGRVVYQELARINKAVRDGSLAENKVLVAGMEYALREDKALHLFGLVSDGGVHSHINHLKALCDIAEQKGLKKVYIHAFMDGRDTDPRGGLQYLKTLLAHTQNLSAQLATVIGRYYAMDRDKRWERVKLTYDLLVKGDGEPTEDVLELIQQRYEAGETDEFLKPIQCMGKDGAPLPAIQDGDAVLCFNFRTDRPREISEVLTQRDLPEFGMKKLRLYYMTMTRYDDTYEHVHVLFTKDDLKNTLGEVLSAAGKTQVRIAETEKYPHVTFFFSGGREAAFPGERRIMIPSPKVATYDLKPEMSANELTEAIVADINTNQPDFICLNYANTDMVGHTGVFSAAVKAAETVDKCVEQLITTALAHDYTAIIIADHGNSDYMINEDGSPNTAHTKNPVPCIFVRKDTRGIQLKNGKLGDLAPTILHLFDLPVPAEMDGELLVQGDN